MGPRFVFFSVGGAENSSARTTHLCEHAAVGSVGGFQMSAVPQRAMRAAHGLPRSPFPAPLGAHVAVVKDF